MIRLVIYVLGKIFSYENVSHVFLAAISAHRLPEDALAEPILEPEVGELEWELSRKQTFRVAERIATISAGGREYLLNVKRIRRRDYSTVTEIPANELWSGKF